MPDLADADLAEVQVRRQARGADEVRTVALVRVAVETAADELRQASARTLFARHPRLAQPAGPIGSGRQQVELLQSRDPKRGSQLHARASQLARPGQRRRRIATLAQRAPEGREDLERIAAARGDLPRLDQEEIVAAVRANAGLAEAGLYLRVECALGATIAPAPEHGRRPDLLRQLRHDRTGGATQDGEGRTCLIEVATKRHQRVMQPPARGAAERAQPGTRIVVDVDRQHRLAGLDRGAQCAIVGKAQVIAQPDDHRRLSIGCLLARAGHQRSAAGWAERKR